VWIIDVERLAGNFLRGVPYAGRQGLGSKHKIKFYYVVGGCVLHMPHDAQPNFRLHQKYRIKSKTGLEKQKPATSRATRQREN
jgi:hypothetical protein